MQQRGGSIDNSGSSSSSRSSSPSPALNRSSILNLLYSREWLNTTIAKLDSELAIPALGQITLTYGVNKKARLEYGRNICCVLTSAFLVDFFRHKSSNDPIETSCKNGF